MRTNLLFGAALIASLAISAPAANAKSSMDHNLKCLWMNTDVAPLHTSARQGVAVNGKFYLQNKDTQKIEIWDQTGKIGELESGKGTNITRDDAGNIIVRTGEFNTNYSVNKGVRIISTTGEVKDFDIAGIPGGRADFWGHVSGNVMSKEGGMLYMGTMWQAKMIEVPMKNGAQDVENTFPYTFVPNTAVKVDGTFSATHLISCYGFDKTSIALLSPHVNKTNTTSGNGNSIYRLTLDEDDNWVPSGFYVTPNHNGCTGFEIFQLNGKEYIVYSTGSNNADGFSVAKLQVKETPANEDTDKNVRISTKYAEMKEDGSDVLYKNNAFYGNHFTVEPATENSVYIYQYVPNAYIAKYELTIENSAVESIEADNDVVVFGGESKIIIESEKLAYVYNTAGALVATGKGTINCANGIYIVKVGNKTAKVVVK